ncbi:MAG: mycofactocin-coupled SDR family oxidoreductase [Bacteroidetes bacterium]|nr:mycofactocin-coupled SDR family oxidoreductase [Bacteroidota bacterium]MCB0843988.1 mycofactocin-coupled SDR family oxidoreductase [Bacteroidota bacterium]
MKKKSNRRQMLKKSLLAAGGLSLMSTTQAKSTPRQTQKLEGKVAFITGGARGIGSAIALRLAEFGAKVAICDITAQIDSVPYPLASQTDLAQTLSLINGLKIGGMAFQADVRDRAQMQAAVKRIVDLWGRLDILVCNAGIVTVGPLETMSENAWQDVIDVNLTGPAICMQAVIPQMRAQGEGRIINIASINGRKGSAGSASYNASKWGLIGLTKSIAMEVGNDNITVNAICPTGVNTDMLNNEYMRKAIIPQNPTEEALNEVIQNDHTLPVGLLSPSDIADSVAYLCSPEAKYISGIALDVTAGGSARNNA